jgi:hypothetical protein
LGVEVTALSRAATLCHFRKKGFIMKSALLLGNGLNQLAGAIDWPGLMYSLAAGKGKKRRKPGGNISSWPLEFERIYSDKNQDEEAVSKSDLKNKSGIGLKRAYHRSKIGLCCLSSPACRSNIF